MSEENYVLKINTALSNKPFFMKITDPSFTMDKIFTEAIATLQTSGKPLESKQLDSLYKAHQLFNGDKVVQKGTIFNELDRKTQVVGNQQVIIGEIDLVSSHSGGSIVNKDPKPITNKDVTSISNLTDTAKLDLFVKGNLKGLTDDQKLVYYVEYCKSLGLNPLTRPFEFIIMSSKETLYAKKDAGDQLRKLYNIALDILKQEIFNEVYIVTTKATLPSGRYDTDIGVVSLKNKSGDDLANAIMKSVTKSKRRVTLSICGLGITDESEIETIPKDQIQYPKTNPLDKLDKTINISTNPPAEKKPDPKPIEKKVDPPKSLLNDDIPVPDEDELMEESIKSTDAQIAKAEEKVNTETQAQLNARIEHEAEAQPPLPTEADTKPFDVETLYKTFKMVVLDREEFYQPEWSFLKSVSPKADVMMFDYGQKEILVPKSLLRINNDNVLVKKWFMDKKETKDAITKKEPYKK